MATVYDIYKAIDAAAPFTAAEDWDNSGILVGNSRKVRKILTALDITSDVAREAVSVGADLVISHHPVIFKGLKELSPENPAVILAKAEIGAICAHTNVDAAKGGLNSYLCKVLGFNEIEGVCLDYDGDCAIGIICETDRGISCEELGKIIKEKLGCQAFRYTSSQKIIRKIGICSGSGGDFLSGAIKNGCDALITGDVKHSVFISAKNAGFPVFDAGHYYTECIFSGWVKEALALNVNEFQEIEISRAKSDIQPFVVI